MTMELPPLRNDTAVTAAMVPVLTAQGWALLVVLKQRFEVLADGALRPLHDAAVRFADEPWSSEDPAGSSIKYPHDLAPGKPSTDVVVVGDALAPAGREVLSLDVAVEVGTLSRAVRVFGPRTWYDAGGRHVPTDPIPFTSCSIRWENAFGGIDDTEPEALLEEPRNPIGRGLVRSATSLTGQLVPQLEDPTDPIQSHRSRPKPAGLGAIGPGYAPRRDLAGTYDAAWRRYRMPRPPDDLDPRFHQCAPPELQTPSPLYGGEPVRLLGLHRDGAISFRLPERYFLVEVPAGSASEEHTAMLDTVLIEPNELRVELTWRSCFPWPRQGPWRAAVRVRELGGLS